MALTVYIRQRRFVRLQCLQAPPPPPLPSSGKVLVTLPEISSISNIFPSKTCLDQPYCCWGFCFFLLLTSKEIQKITTVDQRTFGCLNFNTTRDTSLKKTSCWCCCLFACLFEIASTHIRVLEVAFEYLHWLSFNKPTKVSSDCVLQLMPTRSLARFSSHCIHHLDEAYMKDTKTDTI